MFGFLAALGPVGITVAVIGTAATAAYNYMKENENTTESSTSSKKSESMKENHTKEINKIIEKEIIEFKSNQENRIKLNYNVKISFKPSSSSFKVNIEENMSIKFASVDNLQKEVDELNILIQELEALKNESNV